KPRRAHAQVRAVSAEVHLLALIRTFSVVSILVLASCSSSKSPGGVGAVCDDGSPCASNLYCYTGNAPNLAGLCTSNCTATPTSDSCRSADPNTACLVAGICARECGNGLSCPSGATCDSNTKLCSRH